MTELHVSPRALYRRSTIHPEIAVPIHSYGLLAHRFCQDVAFAKVEAVLDRCVYLRAGGEFICIGDRRIGNGPVTLTSSHFPVPSFRLSAGQVGCIDSQSIAIGTVRFALDGSELWQPPNWPICPSPDRLSDICAMFMSSAAALAPQEGLARCVIDKSGISDSALSRIARPRIAKFERWLSGQFERSHVSTVSAREAVQGLIGLGPGLTPSGDDFLVGALAALNAIHETEAHAALARAIFDMQPGLTTPLSACFLRAAAAGHLSENLHAVISLLLTRHVEAAIATAAKIGHSSGWDMMAGLVTTMGIAAASGRAAIDALVMNNRRGSFVTCGSSGPNAIRSSAGGP